MDENNVGTAVSISGSGTINMAAGETANMTTLSVDRTNIILNAGNTMTIGYRNLGGSQAGAWSGGDTTIKNNVDGKTAGFHLTGGASLTINNTFKTNSGNASGGKNVLLMTGSGNKLDIQGLTYLGGSNPIGGNIENTISVSGSDSNITLGGLVMGNDNGMDGRASNLLSLTGSNNTLVNTGGFRGRFQIGFNANLAAGTNTLYAKGDGAEAASRVYVHTKNSLEIYGSSVEGSKIENKAHFAGNATFADMDGIGAQNVIIGQNGNYGTSRLVVEGSGNEMKINSLQIGSASQAEGSIASFDVIGGKSVINVSSMSVNAANGSSVSNQFGGAVNFTIDASGISTINTSGSVSVTGYLNVDFSNLSGEFSEEKFTLISFNGDPAAKIAAWYDANAENGLGANTSFLFANSETDSAYLKLENEGSQYFLNVYYSSAAVPEPAAYAAIFGTAALAFAIRRRGK